MEMVLLKFLEKKNNLAINRRQESMMKTFDIRCIKFITICDQKVLWHVEDEILFSGNIYI